MTSEKVKIGEKIVNKFIEMILQRMIDTESLKVHVKANLKQLAKGELDALSIEMFGFLLRRHLRITEFRFNIGASAVNIHSIRHRKIELLHPSEGYLKMVITAQQLTNLLNAKLVSLQDIKSEQMQLTHISCHLAENMTIIFNVNWIDGEKIGAESCHTILRINTDGKGIILEKLHLNLQNQKIIAVECFNAIIAEVSEILSLRDIANQGTIFQFEQIDINADNIILKAATHIEHFPKA